MAVEVNKLEIFDVGQRINIEPKPLEKSYSTGIENDSVRSKRLNCIYDDKPLGFEKDLFTSITNM